MTDPSRRSALMQTDPYRSKQVDLSTIRVGGSTLLKSQIMTAHIHKGFMWPHAMACNMH
jgi:hypothetical protein